MEKEKEKEDEEEVLLPGFRFHPTDEELVGFYLRRKVENKKISIEIIKQVDIYKHDPWDLPKIGSHHHAVIGEKEWYFFCIRGRKYRNSVRPNRVTGSGFWKATGIDKPVYSSSATVGGGECCIGLKKSLVYYRGSAGKGTKTDWMMHEFRLPPNNNNNNNNNIININNDNNVGSLQEAEVWTLCRIFKRTTNYKRCTPADNNSRQQTTNKQNIIIGNNNNNNAIMNSKTSQNMNLIKDMSIFQLMMSKNNNEAIVAFQQHHQEPMIKQQQQQQQLHAASDHDQISMARSSQSSSSNTSFWSPTPKTMVDNYNFFGGNNSNWDELKSVVDSYVGV